jgi:hypothetical protein
MESFIKDFKHLYIIIIVFAFIIGILLVAVGFYSIFQATTGNVELSFFGQTIKSTNIGIVCLFIGGSLIGVLFKRILGSMDLFITADNDLKKSEPINSSKKMGLTKYQIPVPFYLQRNFPEEIKEELSSVSEHERKEIESIFRNHNSYDISAETALILEKLPILDVPEKILFRTTERMFRRPAFYGHKERDWHSGLYAVITTRIVWEQQVMPRLKPSKKNVGVNITKCLLELQDLHTKFLGFEDQEVQKCVDSYLCHKGLFIYFLPKANYQKNFLETMKDRDEILKCLAIALNSLGFDLPDLGQWNPSISSGDE